MEKYLKKEGVHPSFFLAIFIIYILFLPPNITTGDCGELITASYLLGLAHPSGYPLYLILMKLFITILPIGSIPFKCSLFTAIFSVISLYFVYLILTEITDEKSNLSLFAIISIAFSYSYFNQSLLVKFYTLNLFIILTLIYLSLKLIKSYNRKILFLIFFIFGITTGNHHTALLLSIPFLIILFKYRGKIKDIFIGSFFLIYGFLINSYIYTVSFKKFYFKFVQINNLKDIFNLYLLRKVYGNISSTSYMEKLLDFKFFTNAFKNYYLILKTNFPHILILLILIIFAIYFLIKSKKYAIFLFMLCSLFIYTIGLTIMTFRDTSDLSLYVYAHQYFLPGNTLIVILAGIGLIYIYKKFYFLNKIKYLIIFFPLILFPERFYDSLWATNLVDYEHGKNINFQLPINSFYITIGDIPTFERFYLENIANFRRDVINVILKNISSENCIISRITINKKKYYYKSFDSDFFFQTILNSNVKIYSNAINNFSNFKFKDKFSIERDGLLYMLKEKIEAPLYKFSPDYCINEKIEDFFNDKNRKIMVTNSHFKFFKFLDPVPCLQHYTDDYFSYKLCIEMALKDNFMPLITRSKILKWNDIENLYIYVKTH